MRWAGLLRAVNVGGRKVIMAELREAMAAAGAARVTTLLASGNVVFDADTDSEAEAAALVDAALERMGFATDVMMRNAETLARTIAANPFPDVAAARPAQLHVVFHRDPVPAEPVEALPGIYAGPERIRAVGRELFIDYPEGAGESLLPRAMAKLRFPKVATARNWNTVGKLKDMLEG